MRFFFDNCMSPRIVDMLCALEEDREHGLTHLRELYPQETPDPEWISDLGRSGEWIILSGDERISTSAAGRAAWHESGLTAFFFRPPFQTSHRIKQAEEVARWWRVIVLHARKHPRGYGFLLPMNGKVPKQIFP